MFFVSAIKELLSANQAWKYSIWEKEAFCCVVVYCQEVQKQNSGEAGKWTAFDCLISAVWSAIFCLTLFKADNASVRLAVKMAMFLDWDWKAKMQWVSKLNLTAVRQTSKKFLSDRSDGVVFFCPSAQVISTDWALYKWSYCQQQILPTTSVAWFSNRSCVCVCYLCAVCASIRTITFERNDTSRYLIMMVYRNPVQFIAQRDRPKINEENVLGSNETDIGVAVIIWWLWWRKNIKYFQACNRQSVTVDATATVATSGNENKTHSVWFRALVCCSVSVVITWLIFIEHSCSLKAE